MKQLTHRKITVTEKSPRFTTANKARVYINLLRPAYCAPLGYETNSRSKSRVTAASIKYS